MIDTKLFQDKTAWILVEPGLKGTENQCLALAERMGVGKVQTRYVQLDKPWVYMAPYILAAQDKAYSNSEEIFKGPYPDIIIVSGRKAINAGLYVKKLSDQNAFLIAIQNPKLPSFMFDAVIAPRHDAMTGKNVIQTMGALNHITTSFLENHITAAHSGLANMQHPRVAVLIGGTTTKAEFTVANARTLIDQLKELKSQGASLMITTSRRTGKVQTEMIKRELGDADTEVWDGQGSNPYFDYLYYADYIIVTNDSISMASEAIATGKPVFVTKIGPQGRRIEQFHETVLSENRVKPFHGKLKDWKTPPYDDMVTVSQELSKLYSEYLKEDRHVRNETQ